VLRSSQTFVQSALANFHDHPMRMPMRFSPRQEFLAWHRTNIFNKPLTGSTVPEDVF
jgi:hypothetical protein